MATAVIPKSVMRINHNISVGLGEVPAFEDESGIIAWGLPGGNITYSEEVALGWAIKLNATIKQSVKDVKDIIKSRY